MTQDTPAVVKTLMEIALDESNAKGHLSEKVHLFPQVGVHAECPLAGSKKVMKK